jgi:hypothetical protein
MITLGYKPHLAPSCLLLSLLLIGAPAQAYINGNLDKKSSARITIEFQIVRGAIVSQPPGLASGKGLGVPAGAPARPRWLVQAEALTGVAEFDLCLPQMYEGSQLSLLSLQGNRGIGNQGNATSQAAVSTNQYALKLAGSPERSNASACGQEGQTLVISLEPDNPDSEVPRKGLYKVNLIKMIISPE